VSTRCSSFVWNAGDTVDTILGICYHKVVLNLKNGLADICLAAIELDDIKREVAFKSLEQKRRDP
jgi:hypothetical protein